MSDRWFPTRAWSIPASSASWAASSSRWASSEISPTPNVYAVSATSRSSVTPTSIVITSPSVARYSVGIPWTTIAFGEMQSAAG